MKLSDIRATLKEIGVWPSKALGQNFLHDQNLARWIANPQSIKPGNRMPDQRLSPPDLQALVAYLETLQ